MSENSLEDDKSSQLKVNDKGHIDAEWRRIGFHRPLGGFWNNFILVIISGGFGFLITLWIFPNFIMPFPTAIGYENIVRSMFGFMFQLADFGVGRALQRYVAEHNVKSPQKTIKYLQFFIWFQMITGVLQITVIAMWALASVRTGNLAYASWMILLYSTIQFPGMLGIFQGALKAFQRYDKANKISFLQTVVLEMTTRILCILIGRWYGMTHPEVGEMMGATLGSIIGAYIDDFLAAGIGAMWLTPIIQEINPEWGVVKLFHVEFDMKLVKECTWFGIRAIVPSMFHTFNQLLHMQLLITFLPNYATIWGLFTIAESVSSVTSIFRFEITAPTAEAYNNEKESLAQNYLTRAHKWGVLGVGWIFPMILAVTPLIGLVAGDQFASAAPMVGILMFGGIFNSAGGTNANVFIGCNHPEYYLVQNFTEFACRILVVYIGLVYFEPGWQAIAYGRVAGWVGRFIIGAILMNKYLFKFKINLWQTIVCPVLAGLSIYLITMSLRELLIFSLLDMIGVVITSILIFALGILVLPFGVYFPIYALLGGWDEHGLKVFNDAVELSGPSKLITKLVYNISYKISQKSPLFNKFPIEYEEPLREMNELMEIREQNLERIEK